MAARIPEADGFLSMVTSKNGLEVSEVGYFVYCNGDRQRQEFDSKVHFKISVLEYKGKKVGLRIQF